MSNAQKITVSAVVPMYNAEPFISDCLQSLIDQTFPLSSIVCVDDGSSDRTLEIALRFQTQHPQLIKVIALPENKGGAFARNVGLAEIASGYVQLLDADDFLLPGKIAHQVELLRTLPEQPGFIAGALYRRNLSGTDREIKVKPGNPWLALMTIGLGCTCSNLWSMEALRRIGGFNEAMKSNQEFVLMSDLLKSGASVHFDNTALTIVRDQETGKSVSQKNPAVNMERFVRLRCELYSYLHEKKMIARDEAHSFQQAVFDAIRLLYPFNRKAAAEFHKQYIRDFSPSVSPVTGKSYILLYKMFGFKGAESIRRLMSSR
jgi:glycosyltransferase involved in cell wall biosynthesis